MAVNRSEMRDVLRGVADVVRQAWLPVLGVVMAITAAILVLVLVAMSTISSMMWARPELVASADGWRAEGLTTILLQVGVPFGLAVLLAVAVGVGAIAKLSDDVVRGVVPGYRAAMRRGLRRGPALLAAGLAAGVVVLLLVTAAPLLVLAGLVGLLLAPVVRLLGRRFPGLSWPDTRVLALMAVPFAPAVIVGLGVGLVGPTTSLERGGVGAILLRSVKVVTRRAGLAAAVLLGMAGAVALVGWAFALTAVDDPPVLLLLARLVAQVLVVSLPVAVATVLFRSLEPESPAALVLHDRPVDPAATGLATAALTIVAMLGGLIAAVPPPAEASSPARTFVVDDTSDGRSPSAADDATPGDGNCATGGGTCTLRAAVQEANATPDTATGITFDPALGSAVTVGLWEPLVVDADLTIDGSGLQTTIRGSAFGDSGPDVQILDVRTPRDFTVQHLTLAWGRAGVSGGGAIASVSDNARVDGVRFDTNGSDGGHSGAVAVLAGSMTIVNSTFENSQAPLFDPGPVGDVYSEGDTRISFSTLSGATGGSLATGGSGRIVVEASIVAPAAGSACSGTTVVLNTLDTDLSCGDAVLGAPLPPSADNGGWIDTIATDPSHGTVDTSVLESCPPVDGRLQPRPFGAACDIGAFEYAGLAAFDAVVDDLGDGGDAEPGDGECADAAGACTLRAAVEEANQHPTIASTVTFDPALAPGGTIALGSPLVSSTPLSIDGGDLRLTVSGGGTTRILHADGTGVDLALSRLTLADGTAADGDGGGALLSTADTTLDGVTITGSSASVGSGGAVAVDGGSLVAVNTTVVDSTAPTGADVAVRAGSADLSYSTFVGATGGSIHVDAQATAHLRSVIVSPSAGAACTGSTTGSANVASDASCSGTASTSVGLGVFGDHGGVMETVALEPTSGAVDASDGDGCPEADARGVARPQLAACDAGSHELEPVATSFAFTVDDLGDVGDDAPGDEACATSSGACTLRAAVEEGTALAASGPVVVPDVTVDFAPGLHGTIDLGSALHLGADIAVDGGESRIVLDGAGTTRLVETGTASTWSLARLTLQNGAATDADGGGAVLARSGGALDTVTLLDNTSTHVDGGGGALRVASGDVTLTNVTARGNTAPETVGGSVLARGGTATIEFSTIVGSDTPVHGDGSTVSIVRSLAAADDGGVACFGQVVGTETLSPLASCGGVASHLGLGSLGDHGGVVPTIALLSDSPAIDQTPTCPALDARGVARPQGASCDLGAYEYDLSGTTVTVTADPAPSQYGETVTFTATVAASNEDRLGTGDVTFSEPESGLSETVTLSNLGVATLETTELGVGTHTVRVDFPGDGTLSAATGEVEHVVDTPATEVVVETDPSSSVEGHPFTVTATVSAPGVVAPATGDVTFSDASGELGTATLADGVASVEASADRLALGTHEITATYAGDGSYPSASGTTDHTVVAGAGVVLVGPGEATVSGQAADFTVTVTSTIGTATGEVEIHDGTGQLGTVVLDAAGEATFTTTDLAVGLHDVEARYLGDAEHAPATSPVVQHSVGPASTSTSVVPSVTPSVFGQEVDLTATVVVAAPGSGSPTGDVEFLDGVSVDAPSLGSVPVGPDGTATLTITDLEPGTHTIVAVFAGDDAFAGSSGPVDHVVDQADTTTTVTGPAAATVLGAPATFTATVAPVAPGGGVPVGDVEFRDGAALLGEVALSSDGTAELTTTSLEPGDRTITARYLGSPGHVASSGTASHTVDLATVSVDLDASTTSAVTGELVTFTATVTSDDPALGTPNGSVLFAGFSETGETVAVPLDVATGTATVELPAPRGRPTPYLARATYLGDDRFVVSDTTYLAVDVALADVEIALVVDDTAVSLGDAITATVTVASVAPGAGSPQGTVRLQDFELVEVDVDGTRDGDTWTFEVPTVPVGATGGLTPGSHRLTAVFTASDGLGWHDATSDPIGIGVARAPVDVVLTTSPDPSAIGQAVTLTATLTAPPGAPVPDGSVRFQDDGVDLGAANLVPRGVGAVAELVVSDLPLGTRSLTVSHTGTADLLAVVPDPLAHVVEPLTTRVDIAAVPTLAGTSSTVDVFVTTSDTRVLPRPTPTGRILLHLDGRLVADLTPVDLGGGQVRGRWLTPRLDAGAYDLHAVYDPTGGDPAVIPHHAPAEATAVHHVAAYLSRVTLDVPPRDAGMQWGWPVPVSAEVTTATVPDPVAASGTIVVGDGAGTSCTIAAPAGTCDLVFDAPGPYDLTAEYLGDGGWSPATSDVAGLTIHHRPSAVVGATDATAPVTGDPVRASWTVMDDEGAPLAATAGTVRAVVGEDTCTTAGEPTGTCVGTFPLRAAGDAQEVRVDFLGDDLYAPSAWTGVVTPAGCHLLVVEVDGATTGTATVTPEPNCGDGTGYVEGTTVDVAVELPPSDPGFDWNVDWGGGPTDARTKRFHVGTGDGNVTTVTAFIGRTWRCGTVTILPTERVDGATGSLWPDEQPNCPVEVDGTPASPGQQWEVTSEGRVGRFLIGAVVHTTPTLGPDEDFYGYVLGQQATVVTGDEVVQGLVGPACYAVTIATNGDGQGEVGGAPDCANRLTGLRGFRTGATVPLAVRTELGVYVDGWTGADAPSGLIDRVFDDAPDVFRWLAEETNTVTVGGADRSIEVGVDLVACTRLTVRVRGVGEATGSVQASPAGSCPTSDEEGLYERGERLVLEAVPGPFAEFSRWGLLEYHEERSEDVDPVMDSLDVAEVVMDEDLLLEPTFLPPGMCLPVSVSVDRTDLAQVSVTSGLSARSMCPPGSLLDGPADALEGEVLVDGSYADLGLEVQVDADPLVVWEIERGSEPDITLSGRTISTTASHQHGLDARASICQGIRARTRYLTPDGGEIVQDAEPGFVIGLGLEGTECAWPELSWKVGSPVFLVPGMRDDPGWEFVRWEGAVAGAEPLQRLTMDASSPMLDVTAVYRPVCVALASPQAPFEMTPLTEPNCPGAPLEDPVDREEFLGEYFELSFEDQVGLDTVPPEMRLRANYMGAYLNGSVAAVHGTLPEGRVYEGWSANTIEIDPPNRSIRLVRLLANGDGSTPASDAFMTSQGLPNPVVDEVSVEMLHREPTLGEDVTDFFENQIPIALKKALGGAITLAGDYVFDIWVLGVLEVAIGLAEFVGSFTDLGEFETYLAHASATMTFLTAGFDCSAAWAFAASPAGEAVEVQEEPEGDPSTLDLVAEGTELGQALASPLVEQAQEELDALLEQQEQEIRDRLATQGGAELGTATVSGVETDMDIVTARDIQMARWRASGAKVVDLSGMALNVLSAYQAGAEIHEEGLDGYVAGQLESFGWDASAEAAWTDSTVYTDCLENSVPDYVPLPDE